MRILGITVPENKRLEIGLTTFYGIGRSRAKEILSDAKVSCDKRPKELSLDEEASVRKIVEALKIEGDLKEKLLATLNDSKISRLIEECDI